MPTITEVENGIKVLGMLAQIEDVEVTQGDDQDKFEVTEPITGLKVIIDVEESTIIFLMDIYDIESISQELGEFLLSVNSDNAVHGAYGFSKKLKKIIFKDVLEIKNLDSNELKGSIESMIITVNKSLGKIIEIIGG